MPVPVLATKLFAPPRRQRLVERPRLTERLDATLEGGHRLTLVSAPAGFGKTTAVSDWLEGLVEDQPHVRVAWLSLDGGDNDPPRLLAHVAASLHQAGLGLDIAAHGAVLASADALTMLVNEVVRAVEQSSATAWVLALDDVHVIEAPQAHEALAFLLEHLPERLRLVLVTRSDPPLSLSLLRSRGQLVEVRAADLRFTATESVHFLSQVMGLNLTAADAAALERRTEGWIAGLQLAALSLRDVGVPAEVSSFIEAFSGSNRFVIDYLADEVLARQPSDIRAFLRQTAVLERLTGPLCDAVTQGTHGHRTLAALEGSDLFLVPLDDDRTWYRYHHLFADVLRARVQSESPDEAARIHLRASAWFAGEGLVEEAVGHALAGGHVEVAARLVEEALPELRRNRQDRLLLGWLHALPDVVVRRSPVLCLVSGWSSMMAGDLDGLERRLGDAESALAGGAADPALAASWVDTDELRTAPATVSVYRAALAQARGDVPSGVLHARRALDLARPGDHLVLGAANGFLGLAAWSAGEVHEALVTFSEAVRHLHAAGNLVDELDSTVILADMWRALGRPSRARRICKQALQAASTSAHPYLRAEADLYVVLAELDCEQDEVASAEAHLEAARALAERTSISESRHRWPTAMAQVRAARGAHDDAARLLNEAESLYRHGFYPDVRPIAAMRARVQIAAEDLESAAAWADGSAVAVGDDADYLREYEHLTLVRLLLAQHQAGPGAAGHEGAAPVSAVLHLLERLHDAALDARRDGSLQEIRALQALGHHALGDLPSAVASLARSFGEAPEPDGRVRLYLDEGTPMRALLQLVAGAPAAAHGGHSSLARTCAGRLLERKPPAQGRGQSLVDPLSGREMAVLRLLDSELTGPEIARELYVSVNTFRTHTKRIYTKLDVTTRTAAVRRAHEHGLL